MLAAFVLAVLGASLALAPAAPAEAATACRTVGGAPASADGERHATVVVDTGSGAVWSACITLSGTVSGTGALDLAARQIPDLNPVYDTTYGGEGYAVCKLRSVGNAPPGCLGKTAAYWHYYRNGTYSSGGAGSVTVSDGDVEGWRWGIGPGGPRGATMGTEAATASVAPTRPPAATTPKPGTGPGATTPAVAAPGATIGDGTKGGGVGAPLPGAPTTTAPGSAGSQTTIAGAASTTSPGAATSSTVAAPSPGFRVGASRRGEAGSSEQARVAARSNPARSTVADKKSSNSGTTSAMALVGLLILAAGAGVLVRKRRREAATAPPR